MYLYVELDAVKKYKPFPDIPDYISDNLAYELRVYQKEAISRFLFYNNSEKKSPHLLWQMATGSGKTLIMAALILEMFKQGYRNFWFFVNSNNIITKTIDNFTNSASKKYQFAQKIEIDGQLVQIKQVENFNIVDKQSINIKFSTIHILHQLSQPELISENSITLDEVSEMPIILIGDEAHHFNTSTQKQKEEESSWENSVQLVLNSNKNNHLFEFTATANLTDTKIAYKYENKLLYNYDLKHFRNDKYSKDVFTQSIDIDLEEIERIMLRTILISQYRKHIASEYNINLKPVILFKSKGTTENAKGTEVSKNSFDRFNNMIRNLSITDIQKEFNPKIISVNKELDKSQIWSKTVKYFTEKNLNHLISELKIDFDIDTGRVLIHDGTNKRLENQDKLINTLEENDNPVRAIFAVNVLDEGWDVLNLFDIVRLYDNRDGNYDRNGEYKPGNGTISEAQLIGRGARYFPFSWKNEDRFQRKFDNNENEPLRVIEQMHYHCHHNPQYIYEIRQTLIDRGIIEDQKNLFENELSMKEKYKDSSFQNKNIFENTILPKKDLINSKIDIIESDLIEQNIKEIPDFSNDEPMPIYLASGKTQEIAVFEKNITTTNDNDNSQLTTVAKVIPANILRFALNCNKNFDFNKLKDAFPKLQSMTQFIELLSMKSIILSGVQVNMSSQSEILLKIAKYILQNIEIGVKLEQKKMYVTKHFMPYLVSERFEPYIVRKMIKTEKEEGKSQNDPVNEYHLDLSKKDWYVYNDNFGTSEEKSFVKWFSDFIPLLVENEWQEISLVRNEKAVKLYSWFKENLGEGFEPDFVLLMKKKNIDYVFYIEPKGDWCYDKDNKNFGKEQWKENLLLEIEEVVNTQQQRNTTTENWRLIGLPFYNNNTKQEFKEYFKKKI